MSHVYSLRWASFLLSEALWTCSGGTRVWLLCTEAVGECRGSISLYNLHLTKAQTRRLNSMAVGVLSSLSFNRTCTDLEGWVLPISSWLGVLSESLKGCHSVRLWNDGLTDSWCGSAGMVESRVSLESFLKLFLLTVTTLVCIWQEDALI